MNKSFKLLILVVVLLAFCVVRGNVQIIYSVRMAEPEMVFNCMDNSEYTVLDSCGLELSYRFEFPKFKNDTARGGKDVMLLQIGGKYGKYFSRAMWEKDSECAEHQGDITFYGIVPDDAQCYEVFTSLGDGKMQVTNRLPASSDVIRYEETLPKIKWEMGSETREILGHVCFSATARLFGRDYKAWFTPEIPVSIGPWKLHGLPGAVLLAEDSEHLFRFECIGISAQKEAIKMYKWDYDDKSKAEYLKFERDMYLRAGKYLNSSSVRMLISDNSEKGYHKLSEDWSAYYCPLERSK